MNSPPTSTGDGVLSKLRDRLYLYDLSSRKLTELLPDDKYFNFDDHYLFDNTLYFVGDSYTQAKSRKPGLFALDLTTLETKNLLPKDMWVIYDVCVLHGQLYVVATDQKRYSVEENPQFYKYDAENADLTLAAAWDDCYGDCVDTDLCLLDVRTSRVLTIGFISRPPRLTTRF